MSKERKKGWAIGITVGHKWGPRLGSIPSFFSKQQIEEGFGRGRVVRTFVVLRSSHPTPEP